jgi:hypothetical protein
VRILDNPLRLDRDPLKLVGLDVAGPRRRPLHSTRTSKMFRTHGPQPVLRAVIAERHERSSVLALELQGLGGGRGSVPRGTVGRIFGSTEERAEEGDAGQYHRHARFEAGEDVGWGDGVGYVGEVHRGEGVDADRADDAGPEGAR